MQKHDWLYGIKIVRGKDPLKEPTYIQCEHCGMTALKWGDRAYRMVDVAASMIAPGHPGKAPESTVFEHCDEEAAWQVMQS